MTIIQIISTLIVLTGAFGVVNYLFLKLPSTIGILIVALLASISVMSLDYIQPEIGISQNIITFINNSHYKSCSMVPITYIIYDSGATRLTIP